MPFQGFCKIHNSNQRILLNSSSIEPLSSCTVRCLEMQTPRITKKPKCTPLTMQMKILCTQNAPIQEKVTLMKTFLVCCMKYQKD